MGGGIERVVDVMDVGLPARMEDDTDDVEPHGKLDAGDLNIGIGRLDHASPLSFFYGLLGLAVLVAGAVLFLTASLLLTTVES